MLSSSTRFNCWKLWWCSQHRRWVHLSTSPYLASCDLAHLARIKEWRHKAHGESRIHAHGCDKGLGNENPPCSWRNTLLWVELEELAMISGCEGLMVSVACYSDEDSCVWLQVLCGRTLLFWCWWYVTSLSTGGVTSLVNISYGNRIFLLMA